MSGNFHILFIKQTEFQANAYFNNVTYIQKNTVNVFFCILHI